MSNVVLRNVYVLLGIIITAMAIIYFATEFGTDLSPWGRVLDLALLSVIFVALGAHFAATGDATEVVERNGWKWLRVTNALYILGAVGAFAAVIAFFVVPDVQPIVKVGAMMIVGLGLILAAARRYKARPAG